MSCHPGHFKANTMTQSLNHTSLSYPHNCFHGRSQGMKKGCYLPPQSRDSPRLTRVLPVPHSFPTSMLRLEHPHCQCCSPPDWIEPKNKNVSEQGGTSEKQTRKGRTHGTRTPLPPLIPFRHHQSITVLFAIKPKAALESFPAWCTGQSLLMD